MRETANVEALDPMPFIMPMNRKGLVTRIQDAQGDRLLDPEQDVACEPECRCAPVPDDAAGR